MSSYGPIVGTGTVRIKILPQHMEALRAGRASGALAPLSRTEAGL